MSSNDTPQQDNDAPFRDTPHGRIYTPVSNMTGIFILLGLIAAALALLWLLYKMPLGLPTATPVLLFVSFAAILVSGYTAWQAMAAALATSGVLWPFLKNLLGFLLRWEKPTQLSDVTEPLTDELDRIAVEFQRGAMVFSKMGWLYGLLAASVSLLFDGELGTWVIFGIVLALNLAWAYSLAYLGRYGCLPLEKEEFEE